jgi:hypothetical protein
MELNPSTDSPSKGRIHALFTRIALLEQHALTVLAAFRAEAMKADARDVIATLHRAEAWLGAVPGVVAEVEHLVDMASQQLSSLGRASIVASPATSRTRVPDMPHARRAADRFPTRASVPRRLRDRRAAPSAAARLVAVERSR